MARATLILCHDCCAILSADEHDHYVYQCHSCVVIEHDLTRLSAVDPDHPDVARLAQGAVDIAPSPPGLRRGHERRSAA